MIGETSAPDKAMTSMYALGWTQHSKGSQNIRCMAMLQLMLGNIGMRGGGMNALRGHSNIQGLTDLGLMSNLIPGYLTMPTEQEADFATYMSKRGFKPLRPGPDELLAELQEVLRQLPEVDVGRRRRRRRTTSPIDWLPKLDVPGYDVLRAFELMHQGKMNGYFCQGFNPLLSFPNREKITAALSKLKFLVVMDPLQTETARFWENHGELQRRRTRRRSRPRSSSCRPTCFAEDEGSLTNSGRWLQWHWAGGDAAGRGQVRRLDHGAALSAAEGALQEGGRRVPRPDPQSALALQGPGRAARRRRSPRRSTATRVDDVHDPADATKVLLEKGKQVAELRRAARRRHDRVRLLDLFRLLHRGGQQHGPPRQHRSRTTPARTSKWAFSWPANRRILYNRASADLQGKPWDPKRKLIEWDGDEVGRLRRAGHRADRQARRGRCPSS